MSEEPKRTLEAAEWTEARKGGNCPDSMASAAGPKAPEFVG